MTRSPFSLYKKQLKKGYVWYARFYNPKTKSYSMTRSTGIPCTGKKGRKIEAWKKADEIYKSLNLEVGKYPLLISYIDSFWNEDSPYFKSKRITENKTYSRTYIELNRMGIASHVKTYTPFKGLPINELKPGMIEDWKLWMLEKKTQKGKHPVGPKRINDVMQAMSVPIRYLVARGDLERDPFQNIKKVPYKPKEKGILTYDEATRIIDTEEDDPRVKLAVLLAVWAGLRRGEVRGLRWSDIDYSNGIINIQNNYIDGEGSKPCKRPPLRVWKNL